MKNYTWKNRVLLVFTPALAEPDFVEQNSILDQIGIGLLDRYMAAVRASADGTVSIDGQTERLSAASLYQYLEVQSRDFTVILIGKDGSII